MSKKVFSLVLTVLLASSMFAGCKKAEKTAVNTDSNNDAISKITLPISKEKMTITMWRPNDAKVTASMKGFGEIKVFQELEKRTNIHVEFKQPPLGQEADQFNLMMASNDLPDTIYYNWSSAPGGSPKYLVDNQIIKLNDYIDKYAPNFKKLLSTQEAFRKQTSLDDGTIARFPFGRLEKIQSVTDGLQMRQDWLKKLNLSTPTSIEEWYKVLTAFKTKDPNGNGKADEIPFTGNGIGSVGNLCPAFGVLNGMMMKDGKVAYGPIQPEFKNFLTTIANWYKEGLIDPELPTANGTTQDYKITNNLSGAYSAAVMGGLGRYTTTMRAKQPDFEITGVIWPTYNGGKAYMPYSTGTRALGNGVAITSKAKNIKEIVQFLDYGYSEEGGILYNFGIEGESYTMKNGVPTFTDKILKNPDGLSSDQALAQYALSIMDGPFAQDNRYREQMLLLPEQKKALETWSNGDESLCIPAGPSLTPDESKQYAAIMNQVNTYVTEMITKTMMGKDPVSNFDNSVKAIKGMGIDDAIKIQQGAVDRYNKR